MAKGLSIFFIFKEWLFDFIDLAVFFVVRFLFFLPCSMIFSNFGGFLVVLLLTALGIRLGCLRVFCLFLELSGCCKFPLRTALLNS